MEKAKAYKLLLILLLISTNTIFGRILKIPEDYSKIQYGINYSQQGDTILINEGTYYENLLIIGKEIVIASHYILDKDSSHISKTIINGSRPINPDNGSVLSFLPNYNSYLKPRVIGLTITGGTGTRLTYEIETTEGTKRVDRYAGGGIYIEYMSPIFTMNKIIGNKIVTAETNKKHEKNRGENIGGASYTFLGAPSFGGAIEGSIEINPGGNVFLNNYASVGKTFYAIFKNDKGVIHADNCYFDVYATSSNDLPDYWAVTNGKFSFGKGDGQHLAIVKNKVFVSPNGDNSNDGLTPTTAFKTISYALSHIYPDAENPIQIFLEPGIYSPTSNEEVFPLQMISNVTIEGASADLTIIDAEADAENPSRVLLINKVVGSALKNITITGGYNQIWNAAGNGGGIYCSQASPIIENVKILNNSAGLEGGGIYIGNQSNPLLTNVQIIGNDANKYGGGVYIGFESKPVFQNVKISNNVSNYPNDGGGGGIYCALDSYLIISNSEISSNTALHFGGGLYVKNSNAIMHRVDVKNNTAENGAGIYCSEANGHFSEISVSENESSNRGGGIYFFSLKDMHIENSRIYNNSAIKGGGLFALNAQFIVDRVTFAANSAGSGGGMYLELNSQATIINSILWDNTPNELKADDSKFRNLIYLAYSNVKEGRNGFELDDEDLLHWLDGNISADPMFTDPENDNYKLSENSPSVDAGVAYYMYKGKVLVSYSDDSYKGEAPDMGALEAKSAEITAIEADTKHSVSCAAYPNPFKDKISFELNIIKGGDIKLSVYDLKGQEIDVVMEKYVVPGIINAEWDISNANVPPGTYIYRLQTKEGIHTGKIVYTY